MTLYETLGVPRDADAKTIKRAWKKRAMEHHPDRGGDANNFALVRQAYDVLSDPVKREFYDTHGEAPPTTDIERQAYEMLGEMFAQVAEQNQWRPLNYVAVMKSNILQSNRTHMNKINELRGQIAAIGQGIPELTAGGPEDLFAAAVEWRRNNIRTQVAKLEQVVEVGTRALKVLELYRDTFTPPPQPAPGMVQWTRPTWSWTR